MRDIAEPERLYQLRAPGLALDFPPLRTADVGDRNKPARAVDAFRRPPRELLELRKLLDEARLVTLTGPGGTGKTRLAIETARRLLDGYPDGVWFVALDAVRDPSSVIPPSPRPWVSLSSRVARSCGACERLAGKPVLLVLDNLEQVVERRAADRRAAGRPRPDDDARLQPRAAGRRAASTLPGTHARPAGRAGQPSGGRLAGSESVELFVERARAVRPGFALTDDERAGRRGDLPPRSTDCRSRIELAAARVNLLAPAQILARLDHRLSLVAGARRDLPERQRTLRGAIDWSHDLLSEPERAVFRRFAVFAGGADLEAALAVIDPDWRARAATRSICSRRSSTGACCAPNQEARRGALRDARDDPRVCRRASSPRRASRTPCGRTCRTITPSWPSAAADVLTRPDRDAGLDRAGPRDAQPARRARVVDRQRGHRARLRMARA